MSIVKWLLMGLAVLLIYNCAVCRADTTIPILVYHHLKGGVKSDYYLDPEIFKGHLDYLQSNGYHTVSFEDVASGNPLPDKPIILTFDDGDKDQWEAYTELLDRGMKGTFFIVTNDIGKKGYLSTPQIQMIAMNGGEIGSHTVSHPRLTRLKSGELFYELHMSKRTLEDMIHKKVIVVAYPYGVYNQEVLRNVEMAGYWYGRSCDEKLRAWGKGKDYKLPVVLIHRGTKNLKGVLK